MFVIFKEDYSGNGNTWIFFTAMLNTLTLDVLKSTETEGEILNKEQVRSSIARKLVMNIAGLVNSSRNIDGVVEMISMPHSITHLH